jgi:hypothetical protein
LLTISLTSEIAANIASEYDDSRQTDETHFVAAKAAARQFFVPNQE